MTSFHFVTTVSLVLVLSFCSGIQSYEPTWESLDARPTPQWYDDAKFGIFIHWGVFSVPSFGSEWFWNFWQIQNKTEYIEFMEKNYEPGFSYQDFAKDFTAEFYNPDQWADLFAASGARYIVLTSKHHEGYTLWPSKNSFSWNSVDVGSHRDLLGELARSIRTRTNITFGLYHSMFEWFNPLWVQDKANNFATNDFVVTKTLPELYDLVNTYEPQIVWSDGEAEAPDSYWQAKEFLAWLYNESPVKDTVATNDRWGSGTSCKHGGYYTCADRYSPGVLQPHKWENCMTIDAHSWGYRRNAKFEDYLSINDILTQLVKTVSCNGNLLLNVGPTKEGTITAIFEERLRQMGAWLKINGEAIYSSEPWTYQNDTITSGVWFTKRNGSVYASVLSWPEDEVLKLGVIPTNDKMAVNMLGYSSPLQWTNANNITEISFPAKSKVEGDWAWVLKFDNIA